MRWVIHSRRAFEARHALTSYQGGAESAHSHRWEVAIRVGARRLDDESFALDFHQVHALLAEEVEPLENSDLNVHAEIGRLSPTAERVAEFIAGRLVPRVAKLGGTLLSVSVWEGPDNRVDFFLDTPKMLQCKILGVRRLGG
ncbi:MAG: 6-carboxytetrahydropterin synthase [Thermoanaerobaculales bacterium]